MAIFGKSGEERLYDRINKFGGLASLNKELEDSFWKYERLRQTWKYSMQETKVKNLFYKIEKDNMISLDDITDAKKQAGNISKEDEVYKTYFGVLEEIRQLCEKIVNPGKSGVRKFANVAIINKKDMEKDMDDLCRVSYEIESSIKGGKNISMSLKQNVGNLKLRFERYIDYLASLQDLVDKIKDEKAVDFYRKKLSANKKIITAANALTDYFYGENNVIKKGAERFCKENKELYDLFLKCNPKKYVKVLNNRNVVLQDHLRILETLRNVSIEAFGTKNKYAEKIEKFNKVLA